MMMWLGECPSSQSLIIKLQVPCEELTYNEIIYPFVHSFKKYFLYLLHINTARDHMNTETDELKMAYALWA